MKTCSRKYGVDAVQLLWCTPFNTVHFNYYVLVLQYSVRHMSTYFWLLSLFSFSEIFSSLFLSN